jgi:hypothetical protein
MVVIMKDAVIWVVATKVWQFIANVLEELAASTFTVEDGGNRFL